MVCRWLSSLAAELWKHLRETATHCNIYCSIYCNTLQHRLLRAAELCKYLRGVSRLLAAESPEYPIIERGIMLFIGYSQNGRSMMISYIIQIRDSCTVFRIPHHRECFYVIIKIFKEWFIKNVFKVFSRMCECCCIIEIVTEFPEYHIIQI